MNFKTKITILFAMVIFVYWLTFFVFIKVDTQHSIDENYKKCVLEFKQALNDKKNCDDCFISFNYSLCNMDKYTNIFILVGRIMFYVFLFIFVYFFIFINVD